jgi:hypothetical protein
MHVSQDPAIIFEIMARALAIPHHSPSRWRKYVYRVLRVLRVLLSLFKFITIPYYKCLAKCLPDGWPDRFSIYSCPSASPSDSTSSSPNASPFVDFPQYFSECLANVRSHGISLEILEEDLGM